MKRSGNQNSTSPAKNVRMNDNLYSTAEDIEVIHASHRTADADLVLRVLSDEGEPRCLVPLDRDHICKNIPYLEMLCQNENQQHHPLEIDFTIAGLVSTE